MNAERFDVAIVGAGPAGLTAARVTAQAGARTVIVDDNPRSGGQVWRQGPATERAAEVRDWEADTRTRANLVVMNAAKVASAGGGRLLIEREGKPLSVAFSKLILATGARERLLPFDGWTLPGVTGAGGLQALIKGGMPVRDERIVIAGSGPLLLAAADTARRHGARVVAVIEQAPFARVAGFVASLSMTPGKFAQAIALGAAVARVYRTGSIVTKAHGTARVEAVSVKNGATERIIETDRIACGYGLVPNTTLALALGCATDEHGAIRIDDIQRTSLDDIFAAGECTGIGGMERARVEGAIAGHAALDVRPNENLLQERSRWRAFAKRVEQAFDLTEAAQRIPDPHTILCRCEDVTIGEAAQHAHWRDAKLLTRCGMGPCQGRICGEASALYFGWPRAMPRPPFAPVRIDTLMADTANIDAGEAHL